MDFGSKYIYIFSPFSLFVSVYVYASVCDFVCTALLLPFVLGSVCPFVFFFLLKKFFLIVFILITILFYFILSSSFFLSFLPFILSCVEDRLLLLQPGIRAVPLRWESQLQDTGPQETS